MRAALAARVPYSDLGGLYHGSIKQFGLHDDFEKAGVPALLGMGSTPGITNVMAGELARGLDSVDAIHVRVGCIDRSARPVRCPCPTPSTPCSTSSRSSRWSSATGRPWPCLP